MRRRTFLAAGGAAMASARATADAVSVKLTLRDRLVTRAEASNYLATSSSSEVAAFIAALDQRGAPIARGSIGKSRGGRDIPYVVASRPMIRTPQEASDSGRPIVMLVGGLRGGEVEGKEALLALLRDLCISTERTLLEDLVLVFVPLLNPDGNDRFGPVAVNRPLQNGPARVGTPDNGAGFDLDEDFIATEARETQALLAFARRWNPHVFVDMRTDEGVFHDYGVTVAPSLTPAAYFGGSYVRDNLIPKLGKDLHDKFAIQSFVSGHFGRASVLLGPPPLADVQNYGWFAYDGRPRTATNYMGLRGIAALRINGYAHDAFERRIYNVRAALESTLSFCSDNDDAVVGSLNLSTHWLGGKIAMRGAYPRVAPEQAPVVWENLALSSIQSDEPGVPAGFKRTGNYSTAVMPIYDRYDGTLAIDQPTGYLIPYEAATRLKPHLDRHGIVSETLVAMRRFTVRDYVVQRIARTELSSGRHTTTLSGHWQPPSDIAGRFGALYVPGAQPLGPLTSVLLEPESDDGLVAWNVLEGTLKPGYSVPIFRVV